MPFRGSFRPSSCIPWCFRPFSRIPRCFRVLYVGLSRELFALIHVEVLRDFYQQLAVYFSTFTTSKALAQAKGFFGNVSNFISVNW
jgi:hypothetical protein